VQGGLVMAGQEVRAGHSFTAAAAAGMLGVELGLEVPDGVAGRFERAWPETPAPHGAARRAPDTAPQSQSIGSVRTDAGGGA
jgi:hypothetical protein